MNRSLTLLVALVVVATQLIVVPLFGDEPTPARRVSNQIQANRPAIQSGASREGNATRQSPNQRSAATTGGQRVSTRRSAVNAPDEADQFDAVGSGVSRTASRQQAPSGSRSRVQQAGGTSQRSNRVAQASHTVVSQPMVTQEYDPGYEGGEYIVDEGSGYVDGGSCDTCGSGGCGGGCGGLACGSPCRTNWGFDLCNPGQGCGRQLCLCLPSHGWVQMDYLMFWQRGMNIPPLLTTQANAGSPPSLILGNQDILTERMNGGRIRFGWWFANNPNLGVEGEYLGLGQLDQSFRNQGNGPTNILARPFFNVLTGRDDSELVSNTNLNGTFTVNAFSKFDGAAVRFRKLLCCSSGCCYSPVACGSVPTQSRIDATLGWRFFQLKEGLEMNEVLNQTAPNRLYNIRDSFNTRNQFNGVELGVLWQGRRGYWSLDGLMRVSLGNTRHTVTIDGETRIDGVVQAPAGGLLAQQSNIGTYTQDTFGVVPEFGLNLGYQLTPRWRANAGYNFIYWSNVVRPGDQIDTDLNPNFIPPSTPPITGANRPRFTLQESDYWVQGLNLGLEYRW